MSVGDRNAIKLEPVARVSSPFGEKFAVPRQAGLAGGEGSVVLLSPYDDPRMLEGLEGFSHIWLIFRFDRSTSRAWRPRVRPPRLGGNREIGVWASRSPFRPNFLGLSAVRLLGIEIDPEPTLRVAGLDLVDGTPVYDIKPYLPYADAIVDASGGFADQAPDARLAVRFTYAAEADLTRIGDGGVLRDLIVQVLALDPRPAYRSDADPEHVYGALLSGRNVRWRVDDAGVEVIDLRPVSPA